MATNTPDIINVYAPLFLEDEIERFAGREGNYKLDYRTKSGENAAIIEHQANYVLEGVPFAKVGEDSSSEEVTYLRVPNVFPTKIPRNKNGSYLKHPLKDDPNNFRRFYADLLLECRLDSPPVERVGGVDTEIDIKAEAVFITGNFLKCSYGVIKEVSPALKDQLELYFSVNSSKYSGDFEENLKKLTPQELFGSSSDERGVNFFIFNKDNLKPDFPMGANRLSNFSIGHQILEAIHVPISYILLYSYDREISGLWLDSTQAATPYITTKEGGLSTSSGSSTEIGAIKVTNYNDGGHITGTGQQGRVVVATFPGGKEGTALVGSTGWKIPYPDNNPPFTINEARQASISYQDGNSSSSSSLSSSFTMEGTTKTSFNLPLLKNKLGYSIYTDSFPSLLARRTFSGRFPNPYTSPEVVTFKRDAPESNGKKGGYLKYFLVGFSYGEKENYSGKSNYNKPFISYPGAVITDLSVTLLLRWYPTVYAPVYLQGFKEAFHLSLGRASFQTQNVSVATTWEKQKYESRRFRFSTSWEKSFEPNKLSFKTTWKKNVVIRTRTLKVKTKWSAHRSRKHHLSFYTRWNKRLTGSEKGRLFYIFSWNKENTTTYSKNLITRWRTDRPRTKSMRLTTKWNAARINPVKIVPYYVRQLNEDTGKWEHMVSYQVYGSEQHVGPHILNNTLDFYFSNPTKFEIIRFNYNMLPYGGINMKALSDPSLNHKEGIPDTYVFIGNYTIKGINTRNSLSLDITGNDEQLNEARSYWLPEDIEDWPTRELTQFENDDKTFSWKITKDFRDAHHEDVVELDLVILNGSECCFTQTSSGSRCSPY